MRKKERKKAILTYSILLALLLTLIPGAALAATPCETHTFPASGGAYTCPICHTEWAPLTSSNKKWSPNSGNYYLSEDISQEITILGNVTLDLNGHKCAGALQITANGTLTLKDSGTITGTITGKVENYGGTINGGTFNGEVENYGSGVINSSTFNGTVKNIGTVTGSTFNSAVTNHGTVTGSEFTSKSTVTNCDTITGGTFNGAVTNYGTITGGTFNGAVTNEKADGYSVGCIFGGTFNSTVTNNGGCIFGGTFLKGAPAVISNAFTVTFMYNNRVYARAIVASKDAIKKALVDKYDGEWDDDDEEWLEGIIEAAGINGTVSKPAYPSGTDDTWKWYNGNVEYDFSTFVTSDLTLTLRSTASGTPSSANTSSGISLWYEGGNTFGSSRSAVPTGVEIDGAAVSFTGTGSRFTVSSLPTGARWITVRWNSTTVTTNFTPDANAYAADVAIPKTGGISMAALAALAAAAAVGVLMKKNK